MRSIVRFVAMLALLAQIPAWASERIIDYHSEIQVLASGAMNVQERIRVHAEGHQIRRGIYRDFPTDYRDAAGNRYRVGFDLLGVSRDGHPEPYHTERRSNGMRVYAGEKSVFLRPGDYTYSIRYQTDRQLGFFESRDELYWNVTGNDWSFPIEHASARVSLPAGVPASAIRTDGYTGPQGAKGRDYVSRVDDDGTVSFETTAPLGAGEGLTVVVDWPKGYVHEPTAQERVGRLLADNREAIAALIGIALVLVYYLLVWRAMGRDPPTGVIIPEYQPPTGISPGAMRFIRRMGYDKKGFATALVNLAVLGYLQIHEAAKGKFTLQKTGDPPRSKPGPGEAVVSSALFGDGSTHLALEQSNHAKLSKGIKAQQRALKRYYEKTYFVTNSSYLLPGILLSVATLAATVIMVPNGEARGLAAFLSAWLSIWTVGVIALVGASYQAWRSAGNAGGYAQAIFLSLFALPFVGAEVVVVGIFGSQASVWVLTALFALVGMSYAFYQWLKAPTLAGRRLMDRLEGFRLYLSVAEKDELGFKHPPEKTPELFERYLPYAMALDVEQQWASRFEGVLARAEADGSYQRPGWYRGTSWSSSRLGAFSAAMGGTLAGAVASSSHAPGSSSGMGGGGSSGGGGGGGGGGGW